jgi:hypothetical protein
MTLARLISAVVKPIFVSHASADAELVDQFVDTVLRNGCNLSPDDIFYTSGEDTGIPSGEDLIATVRSEVGDATLVIALISPTYQTRPVCVAELGAAWGRSGSLMPLLFPGFGRDALEGVLDGMTIRALDESAALNELHDRVVAATGKAVKAATWSRHKAAFLKSLPVLLKTVPVPATVTAAEAAELQRDLDGAHEALDEVEQEKAKLERDLIAVSKLKDAVEVNKATLPEDEQERFEALVRAVENALGSFDYVVREAIWATRFSSGLSLSRSGWDGDLDPDDIERNVQAGYLSRDDEGAIYANSESLKVERAWAELDALQSFFSYEASSQFETAFKQEHDFFPDLRRKHVWDQLF